jgi:hypothetical protein
MKSVLKTRLRGRAGTAISITAASILASPLLHAGSLSDSVYTRKHNFTLGVAQQTADATIAATPTGSQPFKLTLKDLAIDDQDESFFLEYTYRFKPRWALVAGTYQFGGSGSRTNARDFEYDGIEFTTGTTISAALEIDAYIVDVMYQAYRSERFEVMAGGGVHALDLSAEIRGQVRINETEGEFREAGSTLLAPVPNFRLMSLWSVSDNITLRLNAGWLSATVDDYDGSFAYVHLRGAYHFGDNIGISLGYQFTDIDITQQRRLSTRSYEVALDGPTLTFSYGF